MGALVDSKEHWPAKQLIQLMFLAYRKELILFDRFY